MELQILSEKESPFFNRKEVDFTLVFPGTKTPSREKAREALATHYGHKKGLVLIDHMKPATGKPEVVGYAKLYKSVADAKKNERDYILLRHKLIEKKEED
jgi:small subunit ribosomal protein S24e